MSYLVTPDLTSFKTLPNKGIINLKVSTHLKTSVIISVYKNVDALSVVLDALDQQSVKPFEVIVSEDGESVEMRTYVASLNRNDIVHLTSKDEGWRKNRALNKAIIHSKGDYLIFIDGDVVPHKRFIEGHIAYASPKRVCAGKRAELGQNISQQILNKEISMQQLCDNYLLWIFKLHKDGIRHYEDGIYIQPDSLIYKYIIQKKTISYLIGCNFSCFKDDILGINGFDEDYVHPAIGEDVDINWRFRAAGIEVISCRNIANVYHLWHKKGFGANEGLINNKILEKTIRNKQYICLNGIKKLSKGDTNQ